MPFDVYRHDILLYVSMAMDEITEVKHDFFLISICKLNVAKMSFLYVLEVKHMSIQDVS